MKHLRIAFLLLIVIGLISSGYAEGVKGGDKKQDRTRLEKTTTNDVNDFISINNCLMWIANNGNTAYNPSASGNGFIWPKGSGKSAIFEDGLIWGGTRQGVLHVGGSTYRQGLQAGPIKADGTAANPADPRYTIYKVRKASAEDFATMSADDQTRLRNDFMNWPVVDGAPWQDNNTNGVYDPNFDRWLAGDNDVDTPWFIGDEVLWFVMNDLDPSRTTNLYGSSPIGLEVHTLVWAYNQTGPLGNMVFTKYTVINKGTDDLENAYLAKWSDPDLGDAGDDFVGVDTVLSLGFVYNGLAKDGVYGIPPAAGYDFFQGPIIPSPGDVAHYNFGLREGYTNLGVSSFAFYINGDAVYVDPPLGRPQGAIEMYYYLQGLLRDGTAYIDPTTNLTAKYTLAGDPLTKTGWVDGILHAPDDRRFLMTAGPFTLAKGDTQEVVVSTIVGLGADRLSSLQVLKYYDRFAQLAFDNNFDLPKAPPTPTLKAALHPNRVILSWGEPTSVNKTEKFDDRGYAFQGYNVYQFPSSSSTLQEGKRIATFDLVDNLATIFDEVIDERSGAVVTLPVQFGTDSGIERMISITRDAITDRPLVNNQPYYFAVTAYSYNSNEDATPRQLESAPRIIEVRPQTTNPGYRFGARVDEMLQVLHPTGFSTGEVLVRVVDPMVMTGDSYEVTFTSIGKVKFDYDEDGVEEEFDNYAWNLRNITKATNLVDKETAYGGLETDFYVIDGFQIGVSGAGLPTPHEEILKVEWEGGPPIYAATVDWEAGYLFFGSSVPGYQINQIVEVRLDRNKKSKGHVYHRGSSPNYAYQGYHESPMQVWDVTDKNSPRQLMWAMVEQVGSARQNFVWDPVGAGDREYLFIFSDTYSDTESPTYSTGRILADAGNWPILYCSWLQHNQTYSSNTPWRDGDKWVITPNVPFSADDKFTFTTDKAKATFNKDLATKDVEKINVFPNPYLGANAQELNKYQRFVNFNHLPQEATFRIYTLAGTLVRSFTKNDPSQLASWDLLNDNGLPVGSGVYIIHIDMPGLGTEKILKLGIVSEAQFLDRI